MYTWLFKISAEKFKICCWISVDCDFWVSASTFWLNWDKKIVVIQESVVDYIFKNSLEDNSKLRTVSSLRLSSRLLNIRVVNNLSFHGTIVKIFWYHDLLCWFNFSSILGYCKSTQCIRKTCLVDSISYFQRGHPGCWSELWNWNCKSTLEFWSASSNR